MASAAWRRDQPFNNNGGRQSTTKRELWGWYAYGVAAEVFAVCGVGSFLPVTLEQLARERGVLRSDGTTPCISSQAGASRALVARAQAAEEKGQCVVQIFGSNINTSSFALYTFSFGVFVQALVLISISAIADYGANRKKLLLALSYTGATSCMLFLVVFPSIYLIAPFLVAISIACLGNSFVLLNSFLPLLVSNHPSIRNHSGIELQREDFTTGEEDDTLSLHDLREQSDQPPPEHRLFHDKANTQGKASPELKLSSDISSKGVGIGYAAAVFVQIISIAIIILFHKNSPSIAKSTLPMRVVLFVVGLWWAVFTIPTALWLRPRPGPPLPSLPTKQSKFISWFYYAKFAWQSLWRTIKTAAKLRQVVIFLVGWFMLSDAIATIQGTAILFARTELQMETTAIAGLSILATSSGFVGATVWPYLARRFKLSSKNVIITCITVFEIIPLYGLLGFLPFVRAWGVGGLQKQWEIFPMAFILGFVMGGLSSYCRSFYGALIPPGSEAAFYALYAVTDKGSSVIGPAIVGRIIDATGSIRTAFLFLAVLMASPIPFIWFVDAARGRQDARSMTGSKPTRGEAGNIEEDRSLLEDHYIH
ncbi:MAG: Autophagy protein 22 [Bogoriella megaspora]|nr:MAG: Autophagy protein 22 [Bogoriella megaspora]